MIKTRVAWLDLLRGVAIVLVVLRHSWPKIFGGAGMVGVEIFFTLSGYLITQVLMNQFEKNSGHPFRKFYVARLFRLFPALLFFLAGISLVSIFWNLLGDKSQLVRTWLISVFYLRDLPFWETSSAIKHLWTLAVEEQFYLIWPLVIFLAVKKKISFNFMATSFTFLIFLGIFSEWMLDSADLEKMYSGPASWAIGLVVGAFVGFTKTRAMGTQKRWVTNVAAVVLALLCIPPFEKESLFTYLCVGPIIALCTVVLISNPLNIRFRPLEWFGRISYAMYLWNFALIQYFHALLGDQLGSFVTPFATVVMATISWYVIEKPAMNFRARLGF